MISITDSDVAQKIALVEGQRWIEDDKHGREMALRGLCFDQSLENAQEKYQEFKNKYIVNSDEKLLPAEWQMTINAFGYSATIYGLGGWSRYFVLASGEVVFSAGHAQRLVEQAEKVGFFIWR
jgi:hypothetical protein